MHDLRRVYIFLSVANHTMIDIVFSSFAQHNHKCVQKWWFKTSAIHYILFAYNSENCFS